jgi:hypothetical protein
VALDPTYQTKNYEQQGGNVWVIGGELRIEGGKITNAGTQASAIASLTDNSAGTANDTIQAIPDPADTPASADALRDDLVTNVLPAIRNDIADLTAKVNAILAALRGTGAVAP